MLRIPLSSILITLCCLLLIVLVNISFAKAAKNHGLKTCSSCGIIGFNAPEYFFTLYGCWLIGAVTTGIYTTNAPDACEFVLNHSESVICVCQGGKQAEKIYGIRSSLPYLKAVIVYWPEEGMPKEDPDSPVKLYTWDQWLQTGSSISEEEIIEDAKKVEPGSCATLIYTSGTTVCASCFFHFREPLRVP